MDGSVAVRFFRSRFRSEGDSARARSEKKYFEEWARFSWRNPAFRAQKPIGWVLRAPSKKRPELVRAFVARHGELMSGASRAARRASIFSAMLANRVDVRRGRLRKTPLAH